MTCLRLFVALLIATTAVKESKSDELLIIASRGEDDLTTFYLTDVDLKNPTKLLTIPNVNQPVDNLFVNLSRSGNVLFWSYKDSENIGYLNLLNKKKWKHTGVNDARNGVFLGPGNNDKIYIYLNEDRKFRAYNFKTTTSIWDWDWFGLEDEQTDMQCMTRDPCQKELVLFVVCSGIEKCAYKINIETQKYLQKIPLNDCYKTWRIAPNVEDNKVFAAKGRKIFMSERNQEFQGWLDVGSEIFDFAVGKNYLFVITDTQRKVIRINWRLTDKNQKGLEELKHDIKGKITNLIVYKTSKDC